MKIRIIVGIIALFGIFLVSEFTSQNESKVNVDSRLEVLTSTPDFDYQNLALRYWAESKQADAVLMLHLAKQFNKANTEQILSMLLEYQTRLVSNKMLINQIKALGLTFDGAEESNVLQAEPKGKLWQEFRQLSSKVFLEPGVPNGHIGLLEQAARDYPKATTYAEVLKVLYVSKALNGTILTEVSQAISVLNKKNGKLDHVSRVTLVKEIVEELSPIKQLIDQCSSWVEVKSFLQSANSFDQLRAITKIIESNNNNHKLTNIIVALGQRHDHILAAVEYVKTYGQRGLDNLEMSLKKGATGVEFVLNNPTVMVNYSKPSVDNVDGLSRLKTWISTAKTQGGIWFYVVKSFLIASLLFVAIIAWLPKRLFLQSGQEHVQNFVQKNYLFLIILACSVIFFLLLTNLALGEKVAEAGPSISKVVETASGVATSVTAPEVAPKVAAAKTGFLSPMSWGVTLVFLILHAFVGSNTKSKISALDKLDKPAPIKIELLKNLEHDIDLSVYIGLAGTVTSFIIMQFDPTGSRILAYSSTLVGIIISSTIKTLFYQPMLQKLISGEVSEPKELSGE
ncbi:MAG: hypothetical protein KAG98_04690 [Lentisphaeria bacterium]|nr:hypothetical protein [Lentisphaeria bacterium]